MGKSKEVCLENLILEALQQKIDVANNDSQFAREKNTARFIELKSRSKDGLSIIEKAELMELYNETLQILMRELSELTEEYNQEVEMELRALIVRSSALARANYDAFIGYEDYTELI